VQEPLEEDAYEGEDQNQGENIPTEEAGRYPGF
jgi:hypothetical protein